MTTAAFTDAEPPDRRQDGLPVPRRYWSAAAIWLALAMAVLDGTIANVALPVIARELDASAASSVWVINAYQLAIVMTLFPFAALGDKLGYRRVYLFGLAVFTIGSAACALSGSLVQLTAARVAQGLGAGAIMSISAALVRHTYPHARLGKGMGLNALVIGVSAAAGPTIGSLVLSVADWRWIFAVSIPFGLLAIAVGLRALPRTQGHGRAFDGWAALLNAAAFAFLILGAESIVREGLTAGIVKLAIGAVAMAFLVRREVKRPAPLAPVDLLRNPTFSIAAVASVAAFAAQMLAFVALPFHFQETMGRGVVETGLLITPWPLAVAAVAPFAGRLADRYSAGVMGGVGMAVFALGLAALALMGEDANDLDIVWRMALCGLGFGFFQSPNNRAMVVSAPLHRSGAAGGMLGASRLLGQTGGALATALVFHIAGVHAAAASLGIGCGVALAAAAISASRLVLLRR